MHEMSITMSLLEMAQEEMAKNNCGQLTGIKIKCGVLSGVMPDALAMCFEALVAGTPHAGAKLEVEIVPARMQCPFCQTIFEGQDPLYAPCPKCGEEFGHTVLEGKELILARIEAR